METQNTSACDKAAAPAEFTAWFDAAYPLSTNGYSRPTYQQAAMMELMQAAWAGGQAALAESIGAGGVGALIRPEPDAVVAERMQYDVFATPVNVAEAIRQGPP